MNGSFSALPGLTAVVLTHAAMAYVLVAKYRYDIGIARNAATIRLTLPAGHGQVFAARELVGLPAGPVLLPRRPARPGPAGHGLASRTDRAGSQQPALIPSPDGERAFSSRAAGARHGRRRPPHYADQALRNRHRARCPKNPD